MAEALTLAWETAADAWTCERLAALLDAQLRLAAFRDASDNGLQVGNEGPITRVATAVDASLETFEAAVAAGAQLLIVHHGLSWRGSLARVTGLNRRLLAYLLGHNLALYAAHLPLDAHPQLGNNVQLAQALGLQQCRPFMDYHGQLIGVAGVLPQAMGRDAFEAAVRAVVHPKRVARFDYGPETVRTVGICSGGAPEGVEEAARAGLDMYLCGEANLVAYNLAKQWGANALFAGHYATERFGVRAAGQWLSDQTGLPVTFLDFDLPW